MLVQCGAQAQNDVAAVNEKLAEIKRRYRERNAPGYWGCNTRAWLRKLIREIRAIESRAHWDAPV